MGVILLQLIGLAVVLAIIGYLLQRWRGRGRTFYFGTMSAAPLTPQTKFYLDIDGTLIHEDLTENYGKPAAGLEEFLKALRPYDVYWLTTHCRDGDPSRAREIVKAHVPEELHADIDRIKPTVWDDMKTEALDWESDFIWFDNDIFPEERAAFASAHPTQRFIEVDLRQNPEQLIDIRREVFSS